jgi:hypothetical protein
MKSTLKTTKEIVKSPKWQKVRASLVGQWNLQPEWCCDQLRNYVSPMNKASVTELRIIMNYLTSSGFRMGKIKNPCIQTLRTEASMEMKKRKAKGLWK